LIREFSERDVNISELLSKAKLDNDESYTELHKHYIPLIESMTARYMMIGELPPEESSDVRQESEIAFYQAVKAFDISQNKVTFGLFAKICISNRLISYLRRSSAKKENESGMVSLDEPYDGKIGAYMADRINPLDHVLIKESVSDIKRTMLRELSVYEQKIFNHYITGSSAKEIALTVGESEKSVNNAIYRIRAKLRKLITE
jgi:RNA polymerase sigma factor, sigma-70 family